jgi:hypothetical protein
VSVRAVEWLFMLAIFTQKPNWTELECWFFLVFSFGFGFYILKLWSLALTLVFTSNRTVNRASTNEWPMCVYQATEQATCVSVSLPQPRYRLVAHLTTPSQAKATKADHRYN